MKEQIGRYMDKTCYRDNRWDMVKGIGIILMVLGHSGIPDFLYRFIYLFHMGLFFFVAGYFLKLPPHVDTEKWYKDYWAFIKKKLKALWVPYVTYGIFFLVLHNVFYQLHLVKDLYSWSKYLEEFISILIFKDVEPFVGPFWFLRSLFTGIIISYVVIHIRSIKKQALVVLLLYALGHYLAWRGYALPSQLQRDLVVVSAIWLGYVMKTYGFNFSLSAILNVCLFMVLAVSSAFVTIHSLTSEFAFPLAFPLYSFFGVVFCYNLAVYTQSLVPKLGNILCFYGKYSLEVLALHGLGFKISSFLLVYVLGFAQVSQLVDNFVIISSEKTPYCMLNFFCGMLLPAIYVLIRLWLNRQWSGRKMLFPEFPNKMWYCIWKKK